MSDYTTRLALWSAQGQRRCGICDQRVYDSTGFGLQHTESVWPFHVPLVF